MSEPPFEDATARIRNALATRPRRPMVVPGFHPAAVLVPILHRPEGITVLFTRRTQTVQHHPGEVSFPGGRCEPGEDATHAALREAAEEVGLDPAAVDVLGLLDDYPSVSSYVVTPVIAAVRTPPEHFQPQVTEVLEPFEVPLATLLDPRLLHVSWRDMGHLPEGSPLLRVFQLREPFYETDAEGRHKIYFFGEPGNQRTIWGLTAHILKELLDRAFGFSVPDGARGT